MYSYVFVPYFDTVMWQKILEYCQTNRVIYVCYCIGFCSCNSNHAISIFYSQFLANWKCEQTTASFHGSNCNYRASQHPVSYGSLGSMTSARRVYVQEEVNYNNVCSNYSVILDLQLVGTEVMMHICPN